MQTADRPLKDADRPPARGSRPAARRWAWSGLAVVLLGGMALRLWGIGQGLPYAYNADEADHFVPHAVRMFETGTLNPHYFSNPPAFTYLLHYLFALWYGGGAGVRRALELHPSELYTLARVAAAALGTAALWLTYLFAARLFGRGVGLLAAAIEAVAFLPVFYAHVALNDSPTLAPLTLSLLGSAGILRKGRGRDYLLAGGGLGLACATKYTAGIAIVPLLAAALARHLDERSVSGRRALIGLSSAGAAALLAFLIANPYAVLDYQGFSHGLSHQSALSTEAQGKLGAPKDGGFIYYLWSLTWGLGWLPVLAALGGAIAVWRTERRLGWLLVPAPLAFLLFMGLQGRYFGRWLLPIFPILCVLAAFFTFRLAGAGTRLFARLAKAGPDRRAGVSGGAGVTGRRLDALRVALAIVLVAALLAPGMIHSVHSGLVLSRADTRNLARQWMLAHVPLGAGIVVEPIAPDQWARASPGAAACPGYRWCKYASLFSRVSQTGALLGARPRRVGIEDYERTLAPALLGYYRRHGYCWVLSGSTQSGRAFADPRALPAAVAYYRALAAQGEVVYRVSPYGRGRRAVAFNFDWSFDYYPLAYDRPGPEVTLYRLHGDGCRR